MYSTSFLLTYRILKTVGKAELLRRAMPVLKDIAGFGRTIIGHLESLAKRLRAFIKTRWFPLQSFSKAPEWVSAFLSVEK